MDNATETTPPRTPLQRLVEVQQDRDLEELLTDLVRHHYPVPEIAEKLEVSQPTVHLWLRQFGLTRAALRGRAL